MFHKPSDIDYFERPSRRLTWSIVSLENKWAGADPSLRNKIGSPIVITSGYRCITYNEEVRGVKGSYHLFGMAADIYAPQISLKELLQSAEEIGFSGIGYYPENNFLHLDIRPAGPARWQG
ncbi:MAG TPA: D-Ala-D-Ala carboxypeptidase family metallohydrolase [Atribacterota bacterium]|nr:D-Ala-D-Ala carboxypeptidase family metallohydrolase [Atribacterota bacterium]